MSEFDELTPEDGDDGAAEGRPQDPKERAKAELRRAAQRQAKKPPEEAAGDGPGGDAPSSNSSGLDSVVVDAADAATNCCLSEALYTNGGQCVVESLFSGGGDGGCCIAESLFSGGGDCCLSEAAFSFTPDCFVATATLGSPQHPDLDSLRAFRDKVLKKSLAGRAFTHGYYRYGAYAARFIKNKPVLKFIIREGLVRPLARLARRITGV